MDTPHLNPEAQLNSILMVRENLWYGRFYVVAVDELPALSNENRKRVRARYTSAFRSEQKRLVDYLKTINGSTNHTRGSSAARQADRSPELKHDVDAGLTKKEQDDLYVQSDAVENMAVRLWRVCEKSPEAIVKEWAAALDLSAAHAQLFVTQLKSLQTTFRWLVSKGVSLGGPDITKDPYLDAMLETRARLRVLLNDRQKKTFDFDLPGEVEPMEGTTPPVVERTTTRPMARDSTTGQPTTNP